MSVLDSVHISWQVIGDGSLATGNGSNGSHDPIHSVGPQRVFAAQLVLTLTSGILLFLLFCIMRYRWPHIYAVRTLRQQAKNILKPLPNNLFGWIKVVYKLSDDEVLSYSGLDCYVYLSFFKMGIKIFFVLAIFSVAILSPIRYYFTGNYDKESISSKPKNPDFRDDFPRFLWVYPIFTYLFSVVVFYYLYEYTDKVLKTRQKYLASQNSITDRTIRLDGIPKKLLSRERIKKFIEDLGIGRVMDVKLIYDWTPLETKLEERGKLVRQLEYSYASEYKMNINIYNQQRIPAVNPDWDEPLDNVKARESIDQLSKELVQLDDTIRSIQSKFDPESTTIDAKQHPEFRVVPSAFITMDSVASAQMAAQAILDPRVYKLIVSLAPAPQDIIWGSFKLQYSEKLLKSYLITFLIVLSYGFIIFLVVPLTSLLDLKTITKFWPALGHFIGKSKWLTTFVTGILPPLLFTLLNISFPYFYRYLSRFQGYSSNSELELSTLSKNFFFIFFNLFLIYVAAGTFWDYMSYISDTTKIATQLATSLRRMSLFYVDLILLQGLTMFPVKLLQVGDLFLLNVIGKLFFLKSFILKTARDYRSYYYTPQILDFGINLPQHIMIFMIILIYSVVSTKIVTCGLIYFIMGLFVYKYQLVYNFVHPSHSTGKIWPIVFRRVILGLIIFQLFMCGTLALDSAILLSLLCTPLIFVTLGVLYNFEKNYVPLCDFIALRAILNPYDFNKLFENDDQSFNSGDSQSEQGSTSAILDDGEEESGNVPILVNDGDGPLDESSLLNAGEEEPNTSVVVNEERSQKKLSRRKSTIDEEREQFTDYTYPPLIDPLNGPWVGFTGNVVSIVEYRGGVENILENGRYGATNDGTIISTTDTEVIVNKVLSVSEWE
ncbi:hypothetical protein CORT_0A03830 [Candida orthopsilosis Co 90-125]|uniref:DUF221-domain-containing protein n=1 Tax=Candida orthopsilosis (strain 90-125) TaxID=1136231 RepID=H8WWE7_CANO9|nr:hypothetical protein CORT_0A03830 [Candida orthopsilosis Co 90-125]CCG20771.1 hypothetical protein CORT_0A03830 [Candida orthopsilosis Co 90-125]